MLMAATITGAMAQEKLNPWGLVYDGALTENVVGEVQLHPVSFEVGGLRVSANVYTPKGYTKDGSYAAIVVSHPNGGVKEQVSGLFAQKLAEAGYVAIACDARYQGQSAGQPRGNDIPANRIEDIRGMIDFISQYPGVDKQRIGAFGICGGGGYTVAAAQSDHRIKAVAALSMFNTGRVRRNGYGDSQLSTVPAADAGCRGPSAPGRDRRGGLSSKASHPHRGTTRCHALRPLSRGHLLLWHVEIPS